MRTSTSEPDCQTFRRRWELAGPTTAAQPGIRWNSSSRSPKEESGKFDTPPKKIRAVAPAAARCPPQTLLVTCTAATLLQREERYKGYSRSSAANGAFRFKKSKCSVPLAALWPRSQPAFAGWGTWEILLDSSPEVRSGDGVACRLTGASISDLKFPCISKRPRAHPTSLLKCVQVPAEAHVSAPSPEATLNRRPSPPVISQQTPNSAREKLLHKSAATAPLGFHKTSASDRTLQEACSRSQPGCDASLALQTKSNCFNVQPTGQPFGSRFSTLERRAVYRGVCISIAWQICWGHVMVHLARQLFDAILCRRSTAASLDLPTPQQERMATTYQKTGKYLRGYADDRQASDRQIRRPCLIGDQIIRFSADLDEKR
ncbi:hypothetical protein N431DRAFT_443938 [Stipitochalara longipes BDJ]|nr:hypothetical protein N431DRAFT_443938 [Stipitochalara longipes BDJ]